MIRERENVIARASVVIQTALTVLAFMLACWLSYYPHGPLFRDARECLFFGVLIIPLWMLLIQNTQLDKMCRDQGYWYLVFRYLKLVFIGSLMLYLASLVIDNEKANVVGLRVLGLFAIIDFILLFAFKSTMYKLMKFFRSRGFNSRQLLMIADDKSIDFMDHLIATRDWGYRICGIMTHSESVMEKYWKEYPMIPYTQKISSVIDSNAIDEVFYCKGNIDHGEIEQLVKICAEVGVVFRLKPPMPVRHEDKPKFMLFNDVPVYVFRNIPENYFALKVKSGIDFVFSLLVIILLSPVLLFIALAIKLDDGGPVFFYQERVGLNGRRFNCMKFRTMVVNAEALREQLLKKNEQTGPVFKIKMDPRVTRVGKFLRRTSLDELPQFFNVLVGDMAVVGPRPPIPSEVKQYERWQNRRLSMKPGITCIWQVSGRNDISFEEWMKLDMEYIDNWSLKLDLIIMLKTVKAMFMGTGQ